LSFVPEDFVLVRAGRMVPVQDVELLGQVILRAAAEQTVARFIVVGDGEPIGELEAH
jgi:glycosyltransferase involved in cell wall biosynthesis